LLLLVLLATRLLDVHFHRPALASDETPHLAALALIESHHHEGESDHGHLAAHLYEGEVDDGESAGLFPQSKASALWLLALLLPGLSLLWPRSLASPLPVRRDESPPRPRRWARLAPPSQAPPSLA